MSLAFLSIPLAENEFSRRRADARRAGSPALLWPEVAVESWAEAMRHIASAAADVLAGRPAEIQPCEPMALSLACYTSGVGPLLGWWLAEGMLTAPTQLVELLAVHLEQGRARAARVSERSFEIVSALVECGVPVVVLKGGHTAHSYFPDAATRPASDLDLLVTRDSAAQAELALARSGFGCTGRYPRESSWMCSDVGREPRSLWLIHEGDPWSVDLHSSLDFSAGPGASLVRFDSADPIETSEPWPLDDSAGVLSQPLLLLHLAVHASGGLHSLTLLRMVELVFVARQDVASRLLAWDEFLHMGAQVNALGAAYPAISMAERLAPGTFPPRVLEICAELAPRRVSAVISKLTPASAHRVERASIAEHFMWVAGVSGWTRQLASDLALSSDFWRIYEARAYRLLRGRVSR
ncbi:MAG: nucleotidyltransferase family protein [Sphingomicrobium sp.]